MKEYAIPIWKAQDKFDNPSRTIYGERLKIILRKPDNRRNHQLVFIREFKDYFEWNQVDEEGCCAITVNPYSLDRIIKTLLELQKNLEVVTKT
jgi:hypothetical protein